MYTLVHEGSGKTWMQIASSLLRVFYFFCFHEEGMLKNGFNLVSLYNMN